MNGDMNGDFNPPWNDANATDWKTWCSFEMNEGCYACKNKEGALKYCKAECDALNCNVESIQHIISHFPTTLCYVQLMRQLQLRYQFLKI